MIGEGCVLGGNEAPSQEVGAAVAKRYEWKAQDGSGRQSRSRGVPLYSLQGAVTGSTRLALRAGTYAAKNATADNRIEMTGDVTISVLNIPKR